MLAPELARERLKSFHHDDWMARWQAAIARLPPALQLIVSHILRVDQASNRPAEVILWREYDAPSVNYDAICELDGLSASSRRSIFDALFPRIGEYVECGWQLSNRLPYQAGHARKAFRAPNNPEINRLARAAWLQHLIHVTAGYEQDVEWFAAWAAYLPWRAADTLGLLFAAAIDAGGSEGQAVFDILVASANGEHEIGAMGRHVPRAFLAAARPDGWEFIERFLLAAQRQEGLRQVTLESVVESHPHAFRRMARLILEHNLVRFSAIVRAVDVWFGFGLDVTDTRAVSNIIEKTLGFLDDFGARAQAITSGSGEDVYLALWAVAFEDALAAIDAAKPLLADSNVERRFGAAHLLAQLGLAPAGRALLPLLEDPDLRVAKVAFTAAPNSTPDLFERLRTSEGDEELLRRLLALNLQRAGEGSSGSPSPVGEGARG